MSATTPPNKSRPTVGEPPRDAPPSESLVVTHTEADERGERTKPIDWIICKRLFIDYMWRYPGLQIRTMLLAALIAATFVATPFLIKTTIGWTIERPENWEGFANETLGGLVPPTPLAGILTGSLLIVLVGLFFYVCMRARQITVNILAENVVHDLRCDIFNHVQTLHMGYFDRTKVGWILSRGTSDVNAIRNAVAQVIPRTLIHGIETVGFIIIMFFMDVPLALVIMILGPAFWIINTWFRTRIGDAYRNVQFSMSRMTANLAESVAGMRVTQSYAREDVNAGLFRNLTLKHRATNMHAAKIHGLYIPMLDLFRDIIAGIILCYGGWRVFQGELEFAELVGFLLYTGRFFMAISILAEIYNIILQAMAGGERVFKLLDTMPQIVDTPDAVDLTRTEHGARIVFEDVSFGYNPERPVLQGVSFTAEPGQVIALVGHTGSGKTTIVSLLGRLYAHQHGRILIDALPIESLTQHSLHAQMSLVLQDNFLFTGTVMDNIRFGRPDASDQEVIDACRALDCLDIFEQLPGGLHFDAGERGDNLSLGQRQLACFARAWLADPRILMLDEATSAVDTTTEHRLQTALERLMSGRTAVVVAHRLSTIRRADQILVLDHGQLIERGTHAQLLAHDGHYADLYQEFLRLSRSS